MQNINKSKKHVTVLSASNRQPAVSVFNAVVKEYKDIYMWGVVKKEWEWTYCSRIIVVIVQGLHLKKIYLHVFIYQVVIINLCVYSILIPFCIPMCVPFLERVLACFPISSLRVHSLSSKLPLMNKNSDLKSAVLGECADNHVEWRMRCCEKYISASPVLHSHLIIFFCQWQHLCLLWCRSVC